jgi:hypothetical protein
MTRAPPKLVLIKINSIKWSYFPLHHITPKNRKLDLIFHKERGNHKLAIKNNHILEIISEDVKRGFALPLPTAILHLIPNTSLAPLGCLI